MKKEVSIESVKRKKEKMDGPQRTTLCERASVRERHLPIDQSNALYIEFFAIERHPARSRASARTNATLLCARSECVRLRDPYCAWDKRKSKCVPVGSWSLGSNLFQSVATGQHESCPEHGKSSAKATPNNGYVSSSSAVAAEASLFNADVPAPGPPSRGAKAFPSPSENAIEDKDDDAELDAAGDGFDDDASDGPRISPDESVAKYTVETLAIAVAAGSLAALFLGFVLGYCCGRKCRKNEEDNMPYPDTEYEYFEQRQNCHMRR